ncbi:hypothetical protein SSX86_002736 [Deinandra increscens subsp. villosa]|uniref:3-oxo-5-alpha-steroid 4-dehydrogenase C-terminal domain-containing protein n=1 Tax=Deinandra increscens subsp. villosa TaxID=3103831 RepID=A0AAP0DPM9_9ASTR
MVIISFLPTLLFRPPSSLFVTAMSILSCLLLAFGGYNETKGKHNQYSKFFGVGTSKDQEKLASRNGMLLLYTPALLIALVSLIAFYDRDQGHDLRLVMVISALTLHFLKRVFEVLLVHQYSGYMSLEDVVPMTLSYTTSTATTIYAQYLSVSSLEPSVDLKYVGAMLFLVGISGNFYHHCILSNLRKKGDREYKIPKGGLFDLVICPHYLFEVLEFVGVSCLSQTMYSVSFTFGTICYLAGRSYATRKWYVLKFGGKFNKDVKALIPYIF